MRWYFLLLVVFILVSFFSFQVSAVQAKPGLFNVTQPDGSVFQARLVGDEFGAWYENAEGYSMVKNANGWWVIARESGGILSESYARADVSASFLSGIPKHERPARLVSKVGGPVKGHSPLGIKSYVSGTVNVLLLLVNFTDNPRVDAAKYGPQYYSNLYFNASNNLSAARFFTENSYGKFNITGVVGGSRWYTSAHSMSYYGKDTPGYDGSDNYFTGGSYELICEVASLADADVNFADYDRDSDGYIDAIAVVHAGCGQEYGTACTMTDPIWSVRWSYFPNLCGSTTFDGKKIYSGTIIGENSPIGIFAHESGHDFGNLPDLYDTDYSSEGIGSWGLMGAGSWNGPSGHEGEYPSHFCAWSKYFLGWVNPTVVSSPLFDEELERVEYSKDVYQIMVPLSDTPVNPSSGGQKEYFLVENRQQVGFDAYIPGPGVLIWHVDDNQARIADNSFNSNKSDRGVDLEEADQGTQSNLGLDGEYPATGDRGVAADAWKSNNVGFTDTTNPNSKSKAGTATYINITNISASGATMTVDFLGSGTKPVGAIVLLSNGNISPQSGNTDQVFNYTLDYTSTNNSHPAYVNVIIDGASHAMEESNSSDLTYSDGKRYYFNTTLPLGSHNFSFAASDGVNLNTTQTYLGPSVTVKPGIFIASLLYPNTSINTTKEVFFNVTATVSCVGGACGNATATLNSSYGVIPQNAGTPFYTLESNPRFPANLSCLVNLSENSSCNVSWTVNATGEHNTTYSIFVLFNSSSSENATRAVNVTILSLTPVLSDPSPANNTVFEPYTSYFTLTLRTHRVSSCRYFNASGQAFDEMPYNFSQTNSTNHSTNIAGLSNNQTIDLYVRCRSFDGFTNAYDFHLRFRVADADVVLNEISPTSDWIELYNRGGTSVNLSMWRVEHQWSNASDSFLGWHTLDSIVIDDFLLLEKDETNLSLHDLAGEVRLYDRDGALRDNISYANLTQNASFGRQTNGASTWVVFENPTPGYTNEGYYSLEWPMFRQNPGRTGESPENISQDLTQKWNTSVGERVRSSPVVSDGVLYAASWNGSIYGINASTGNVIWNYSSGEYITSSPAVSGGKLFIGTFSFFAGNLLCLNASDGRYIWNYSLGNGTESSPLVNNNVAYIGANNGRLYALNISSGLPIWSHLTGNKVRSSPALKDGILYFGSDDKKVYALNASDGSHVWNYTTSGKIYSTPAVSDTTVVLGSYDDKVYALNALNGTSLWNYTTSGGVWSSPAISGDLVFIGSNDRKIYAINLSSGTHVWNLSTGDEVVSSPAVSRNLVFATSKDNYLLGINKANGSVMWEETLGIEIYSSPAISDGMVFVGADDFKVYAFGILNDTLGPDVSLVWPPNGYTDQDGNINLLYNVSDADSAIANCSLFMDDLLNQTSYNVFENVNQSFSLFNLANNSYNWSVRCVDNSINLNVGLSLTRYFNVSIGGATNFWETTILGWNLISIPMEL